MTPIQARPAFALLGCLLGALSARADWFIENTPIQYQKMGGNSTEGPYSSKAQAESVNQQYFGGSGTVTGSDSPAAGSGVSAPAGGGNIQQQIMEQGATALGNAVGTAIGNAIFNNNSAGAPSPQQLQLQQQQVAARQLNDTGIWYLRHKNYDQAINEFQQALAQTPNDQTIAGNIAYARQLQRQAQRDAAAAARTSGTLGKLLSGTPLGSAPGAAANGGSPLNLVNLGSNTSVVDLRGTTKTSVDPAMLKGGSGLTGPGEGQPPKDLGAQFDSAIGGLEVKGPPQAPQTRTELDRQFDTAVGAATKTPAVGEGPSPQIAGSASTPSSTPPQEASRGQNPGAGQTAGDFDQALGQNRGEEPARATVPPREGGAPETAAASPVPQQTPSPSGSVGNPDFDGSTTGNAPLGKLGVNGSSTGTRAFGDANSAGLTPDSGDTSVVDLRGKTGIVDPSSVREPPQVAPNVSIGHDAGTESTAVPALFRDRPPKAASRPLGATVGRITGIEAPLSPEALEVPRALAARQDILDAMHASAAAYHPGQDATLDYKVLRTYSLNNSGTEAVLYGVMGAGGKPVDLILAFRGTVDETDWIYGNTNNTILHRSEMFASAVKVATRALRDYPNTPLMLTGHSLGGGEAALASVATGLRAITFNAEGVRPADYGYTPGSYTAQITNYHVFLEALTTAQKASSLAVTVASAGSLSSSALPVDMSALPEALGRQIMLAPVTNPLTTFDNHTMEAVEPSVLHYLSP